MSQFDKLRGKPAEEPIRREDFEATGERWEKLNYEYDAKVRELFHDPARQLSPAELAGLQAMQRELFELESKLLKMYE